MRIWVFVIALACGCSNAEQVTCTFLEGPNCWRTAANEAMSCRDTNSIGSFNQARTSCTFADGSIAAFNGEAPSTAEDLFDYELLVQGESCVSFRETLNSFELTTASGIVSGQTAGTNVVITCPDQTQFQFDSAEAFACIEAQARPTKSTSGDLISFSLPGSDFDPDILFTCRGL